MKIKGVEANKITEEIFIVKANSSIYLFGLFWISLFVSSISYYFMQNEAAGGLEWASSVTYLTIFWLLSYLFLTYKHYKSFYLYATAYIICLCVFHFGMIFQLGLGVDLHGWEDGLFRKYLEKASWLALLSLCCFGIGVSSHSIFLKYRCINIQDNKWKKAEIKRVVYWSGVGLLAATMIFFVMALVSYGNILDYARHEIFRSDSDSRGFGLFTMTLPSAAMLLFFGESNKKQKVLAYSVVLLTIVMFIFSGYRSLILFPLLVAIITWVKIGNKISAIVSLIIFCSALFIISFSGVLRTMGTFGDIDNQSIFTAVDKVSVEDVGRLGKTIAILAYTLKFVPKDEPYRYGYTYLLAVEGMVPNVGQGMDYSNSRKELKNKIITDKTALYRMTPSDWMTYKILRDQFDIGQGVGYSGVAEPYLNYGIYGVVIFFVFLGVVLGIIDTKYIFSNQYIFLLATVFFSYLLPTVRNNFGNFTKPAGFIIIILLIWWICSYLFFGKKFRLRKVRK